MVEQSCHQARFESELLRGMKERTHGTEQWADLLMLAFSNHLHFFFVGGDIFKGLLMWMGIHFTT